MKRFAHRANPFQKNAFLVEKNFVQNLRFTILVCCDGVGSLAVILLLLFSRQLSFVELAQDFVVKLKIKYPKIINKPFIKYVLNLVFKW